MADGIDEMTHEVDVVDGSEAMIEDLFGHVEMAEVGFGEVETGVTLTAWIDWRGVGSVLRIGDVKRKVIACLATGSRGDVE